MRGLIFIAAISVSACSYTPVADLRASGETAQLYQRDLNECRQLIKAIDLALSNRCQANLGWIPVPCRTWSQHYRRVTL